MTTQYFRTTDSISFAPELITYNDLLIEMIDYAGARISDVEARIWKRACVDGMRSLCMNRAAEWRYYNAQCRFLTDASVELTGYYDHTGGSSELLLTVTSGTIPSWIEFAHISYSGTYYEVARKLSSTTIALSVRSNPGADIGSVGSPVVFDCYRTAYPLPADFLKFVSIYSGTNKTVFEYVTPDDSDYLEKIISGSGRPFYYTIVGSQKFYGTQLLVISPKTTDETVIDIQYRRYARSLQITGFDSNDDGTLTTNAGDLTATVSGATLTSKHLGAVIRVRADTTAPEGTAGESPYSEQRVIVNISGATITVDRAWEASYSAKAFIISDPVDVAPHMLNALRATIKKYVSRGQPREAKELAVIDADAYTELTLAMEADRSYHPDWRSPILVDRIHL